FERSEKFERSKIRVGSPGLKNLEASKFFLGPRDICAEHSCLSSKIIMDSEALQQLFSCIEASAPPWIVVVGPIIVGPTIVAVVGVVIRSIVGPVGVTIGAMPDFLDSSSAKLA